MIITGSRCKEKNSNTPYQEIQGIELTNDTLVLLAGNHAKFWDVLKEIGDSNIQDIETPNWMFSIGKTLVEYSYANNERHLYVYGEDVILGELKFDLNKDTLFVPELSNRKYLIKKLVEDTLVVQQILKVGLKKPTIYVKSKNQTKKLEM